MVKRHRPALDCPGVFLKGSPCSCVQYNPSVLRRNVESVFPRRFPGLQIKVTHLLEQLAHRLAQYSPRELTLDYPEAGILVPVTNNAAEPEIVFTQRAAHLKTHRGQVAFPGGKRDVEDATLLDTALRESWEEIGLPRKDVRVLGKLSQVVSRYGIVVTPYVGLVPQDIAFKPNLEELDSVFKVPISFFLEDQRLRTDTLSFLNYTLYVPCYEWQGYHIWGMSAIVLVDLLNTAFDADIDMLESP